MKTGKKTIPQPKTDPRDELIVEGRNLLDHEKEPTGHGTRVNARRRWLPKVKIYKDKVLDGSERKRSPGKPFDGRSQLIVYHFMFDREWEMGY